MAQLRMPSMSSAVFQRREPCWKKRGGSSKKQITRLENTTKEQVTQAGAGLARCGGAAGMQTVIEGLGDRRT